jgi:hypothetical protein
MLDTYLVDEAFYVGYSLGARVGWEVVQDIAPRIPRAVLGGVPDGIPLARLDLDQVRALIADGTPVTDRVTQNYIALTERVPGNDLRALLAIAEGMRSSKTVDPDPAHAPQQPVMFATGSLDGIIEGSKTLAAACPQGRFVEIPDRHHFNAPGSRVFRGAALEFLGSVRRAAKRAATPDRGGSRRSWRLGIRPGEGRGSGLGDGVFEGDPGEHRALHARRELRHPRQGRGVAVDLLVELERPRERSASRNPRSAAGPRPGWSPSSATRSASMDAEACEIEQPRPSHRTSAMVSPSTRRAA